MPAQAGIQVLAEIAWIPAFSGMTLSVEQSGDEVLRPVVLLSANNKEEFYRKAESYENNSDI